MLKRLSCKSIIIEGLFSDVQKSFLVSPMGRVSPDISDSLIFLTSLIAADCQETFISKSVLEWHFSGPSADLTESFNVTDFLDSFVAHSIDDLSSADYSDEELLQGLRRELVEAGLVTELRPYQLKGVRWLGKKLGLGLRHNHSLLDGDSSSSSSNCNNDHAMDFEALAAFRGWVRLTENISNLTSSTLPSTSSSSSCEFSVWRNYQKGEIFDNIRQFLLNFHLSDRLTTNDFLWMNLLTGQVLSNRRLVLNRTDGAPLSCVLADEMGIGKSVQVLSFILILLKSVPASSNAFLSNQEEELIEWAKLRYESSNSNDNNETADMSLGPRKKRKVDAYFDSEREIGLPCLCRQRIETSKERKERKKEKKNGFKCSFVMCVGCRRSIHVECASADTKGTNYGRYSPFLFLENRCRCTSK